MVIESRMCPISKHAISAISVNQYLICSVFSGPEQMFLEYSKLLVIGWNYNAGRLAGCFIK